MRPSACGASRRSRPASCNRAGSHAFHIRSYRRRSKVPHDRHAHNRPALDRGQHPEGSHNRPRGVPPQVPSPTYRVGFEWLLAHKPLEWYRSVGFQYMVTTSYSFDTYKWHPPQDAFYASLLAEPIVLDLWPEPGQPGPRVVVVKLRPAPDSAATP